MANAAPRYAKALLEALSSSGQLESRLPLLRSLAELPSDVTARLSDSTIPSGKRASALLSVIGNPSTDSVLGRFVGLLAGRRRLGEIADIATALLSQHELRTGIVKGVVHAKSALSNTQIQTLEKSLSRSGSKVELSQSSDDSILGGFRVRLGDTVLDATANNQLNQARRALLSA
jgi:F-type H+-transporting ATPase subunit delta